MWGFHPSGWRGKIHVSRSYAASLNASTRPWKRDSGRYAGVCASARSWFNEWAPTPPARLVQVLIFNRTKKRHCPSCFILRQSLSTIPRIYLWPVHSSLKISLHVTFFSLIPCLVCHCVPSVGCPLKSLLISNGWFCNEGCGSSHWARCSRRPYYIHQLGKSYMPFHP